MALIKETLAAYSVWQWLLFFFFYNFVGWVYETAYVSIKNRKFENRGFLWGPQIPLYGSGALLMLFLAIPVKESWILTYLVGMVGATALEFVVGIGMEAIFKVKYWDYSHIPTNIKGVICLPASLLWGLFSVLLINCIHKPVETFVLSLSEPVVILMDVLFIILFVTDFAASLKAALELRDMLEGLTKLRSELGKVQAQLANASEQFKEEMSERAEAAAANLEMRLEAAVEMLPESVQEGIRENMEELKELRRQHLEEKQRRQEERSVQLQQLKAKAAEYRQQLEDLNRNSRRMRDALLSRHSGIHSVQFADALKEAREHLQERSGKRK